MKKVLNIAVVATCLSFIVYGTSSIGENAHAFTSFTNRDTVPKTDSTKKDHPKLKDKKFSADSTKYMDSTTGPLKRN